MTRGAGSLQRRLTLSIASVVGLALAALSCGLYLQYRWFNRDRFDERLAASARAAVALVDDEGLEGRLDAGTLAAASLDQSRGRTWLQLWGEDGTPLSARGAAPGLPAPAARSAPRFSTIVLPDGSSARLYQAWLPLRPATPGSARVAVSIARDVSQVRARITRHGAVLFGSTAAVVILAAAVVSLIVRRSMRHVSRLASAIGSIDASSLGSPLELHGLPDELRPPFVKVNELLARIASSLARERQFSADVSHELRTPLAGLRTILEVSAARDRPAADYRASVEEALEVVHQLEAIVEDLILLARLGAGQGASEQREPLRLRDLVESCFAPHADAARRRGLRFEDRVPAELVVTTEKLKLRLVIANLLSNAVEYTAEGGWIAVESDPAGGVILAVRDSGPAIPEESLARIFDPFFRLDTARSRSGEHCGVGLALARGLCDALGYRVEARNEAGGAVAFVVTRAAAPAIGVGDLPADAAAGALSR